MPSGYSKHSHGYSYDFFLSYSRADQKWVGTFYRDLVEAVNRSTSPDVCTFFDQSDIDTGTLWERRLDAAVRDSGLLVPILSFRFFESEQCQKELRTFIEAHAIAADSERSRIAPVELSPAAAPVHALANIQVTKFFKKESGTVLEFERSSMEYKLALARMAQGVAEALKHVPKRKRFLTLDNGLIAKRVLSREFLGGQFDMTPGTAVWISGTSPHTDLFKPGANEIQPSRRGEAGWTGDEESWHFRSAFEIAVPMLVKSGYERDAMGTSVCTRVRVEHPDKLGVLDQDGNATVRLSEAEKWIAGVFQASEGVKPWEPTSDASLLAPILAGVLGQVGLKSTDSLRFEEPPAPPGEPIQDSAQKVLHLFRSALAGRKEQVTLEAVGASTRQARAIRSGEEEKGRVYEVNPGAFVGFDVRSPKASHLYFFGMDPRSGVALLFPNSIDLDSRIREWDTIHLPSRAVKIKIESDEGGVEYFLALCSEHELDLDPQWARSSGGNRYVDALCNWGQAEEFFAQVVADFCHGKYGWWASADTQLIVRPHTRRHASGE